MATVITVLLLSTTLYVLGYVLQFQLFLSGNKHFISVVVIVVEGKGRCATHFYGLIELKDDQTALTQFDKLKERFQVK